VEWSFGDVIWAMIVFYFWFLFIWAFIRVFADIFRRDDLPGWAKAGWTLLIVVVPFLGILIYLIARPRRTGQYRQMMTEAEELTGIAGQLADSGVPRR
jgi:Phospholipase_D-nuclease N-terminal